jgi:hypothetical protein
MFKTILLTCMILSAPIGSHPAAASPAAKTKRHSTTMIELRGSMDSMGSRAADESTGGLRLRADDDRGRCRYLGGPKSPTLC